MPERIFRVQSADMDGNGVCHQTMTTGAWMLAEDGSFCAGSLGVLADNVLGNAAVVLTRSGQWPVTTELSLDIGAAPPCNGSSLYAEGFAEHADDKSVLASGRILDASGGLVAVGLTRLRYVAVPDEFAVEGAVEEPAPSLETSTLGVIGAEVARGNGSVRLEIANAASLSNPMGNVHGGILLCAAEIAGSEALRSDAGTLRAASLRIVYLRPAPAGEPTVFTADVVHRGRTFGVAQVVASDASGRTCAIATISHQG